ncbi:MAG: response regulator [Candidatus Zixiibacteriota bacterium]|nr:MAG: response regulator [candidate division Zixibacteria bacterium]
MAMDNIEKLNQMAKERGNPFRVLIVDDEKWVQDVFKDFCALTDAFTVDMADNGADAVEKARTNKYDLITLDLIMPEMSGLEVLEAIQEVSPHVPVMIITGNATEKVINKAGIMGACSIMYKPIMLENFIAEVMATLSK